MKRRSRNLVLVGVAALGALASQIQAQGLGTGDIAPLPTADVTPGAAAHSDAKKDTSRAFTPTTPHG